MDRFSPELALLWLRGQPVDARDGEPLREESEVPSRSQQEALEALAERVSAARCVV
jgi:hypothetical protein